jgi:hypothetical protein
MWISDKQSASEAVPVAPCHNRIWQCRVNFGGVVVLTAIHPYKTLKTFSAHPENAKVRLLQTSGRCLPRFSLSRSRLSIYIGARTPGPIPSPGKELGTAPI